MSKKPELVKLYYRIGEVSQIVGVQPHVLRYWETEFRTIRPQKSNKGQRIYSRRDVEKLLRVKDLLRNQGFTIAGARRRLREVQGGVAALQAMIDAEPGTDGLVASPEAEQAPAPVVAFPVPSASVEETLVAPADRSAKPMRRALVALREEIMDMLDEVDSTDPSRTRRN